MHFFLALLFATSHPLPKPGQYEFTVESTVDGRPLPKHTSVICVGAEEAAKRAAPHEPPKDCTFTTVLDEATHVVRNFSCAKFSGTFDSRHTDENTWVNVMTGTFNGKPGTQRMTMRRLGDCPK